MPVFAKKVEFIWTRELKSKSTDSRGFTTTHYSSQWWLLYNAEPVWVAECPDLTVHGGKREKKNVMHPPAFDSALFVRAVKNRTLTITKDGAGYYFNYLGIQSVPFVDREQLLILLDDCSTHIVNPIGLSTQHALHVKLATPKKFIKGL